MTRYAIDLDGTLVDTVGATLGIFNERYGTRYTKADVTDWRFWNVFPELQHLREAKRRDIVLRMMDQAWLEGRVKPEPGAAEFMIELMAREPQVDIVTGRSMGTPTDVIEAWLTRNDIPYRNLVRVRGSQEKVYHGYDVYADDDPNLAMEIDARWPDKRMVLIDQPWNGETLLTSGRVTRVRNLRRAPLPGGRQERLFRREPRHDVRVRGHWRMR